MKASAFHDADFSPIDLQNPVEEFQGTCKKQNDCLIVFVIHKSVESCL
jgi:hypothetical protein